MFTPHQGKYLGFGKGGFEDVKLGIFGQGFHQQLGAHGGAVGSENAKSLGTSLAGLVGLVG